MKLSKLPLVLLISSLSICFASATDYTRGVVFTVKADPITSSSSSVTLTVNGTSQTFYFSGTAPTWSTSTLKVDLDVGEETNATVSSSNVSNFWIHGRQDKDTDNLTGIYVEMGDDSRSSFIDKSAAGSSFPVRARLGNFSRGESAGAFDYERSFNTLWYYDTRPMSGHIRISLGTNSSGNSAGYLLYKADKTRSITADGIIFKKGVDFVDLVLLSNSKRQIRTSSNLIEIEKGSTNKKAKIKFYPAEGSTKVGGQWTTSASVSLLYEVDESSVNYSADWTRTIGSEVKELEYLQSWSTTVITSSSWDRDNIIEVWPWHDPSQSSPRKVKAVTGYRESEILTIGPYSSYYYYMVIDPEDSQTIEVLDGSTVVQRIEQDIEGSIKKGDYWARKVAFGGASLWVHGQGHTSTTVYTSSNLDGQTSAAIGSPKSISRTFLNTDSSLVENYEYVSGSNGEAWPSKVETKKGGTVVSLTTNSYIETTFDGQDAVEVTSVASTGSGTLSTVTLRYAQHIADPRFAGKPISIERPDGTKTSYGYEEGTWNGTSWTASSTGLDFRTVEVTGTATNVSVGYSYKDKTLFDGMALDPVRLGYTTNSWEDVSWSPLIQERIYTRFGETVLEAEYAHINGSYHLVSRLISDYTDLGQLEKKYDPSPSPDLVHFQASYTDGKKMWEEDISGTRTTFAYNSNTGLVSSSTKEASGSGVPAVVTTYFYDAAGRLTKETVGGDVHYEKAYDTADRVTSEKAPGGYTTTYVHSYSDTSESTVTKTNPDLSTEVRTTYRDGRLKSVTGTAVPDVTYSYSYSGSDFVTTENHTSGPDLTTRADMLGRVKQIDTPKKGGGVMKTVRNYNAKGQMDREEYLDGTTEVAPTRYNWYDSQGQLFVSGLDTDTSDDLTLNADADTVLHQHLWIRPKTGVPSYLGANQWHYRYSALRYTKADDDSWKIDSQVYSQLSGLNKDKTSYDASRDGEDNWTLTTTSIDTDNNQIKNSSNIPGSANDVEVVYRSGVPISDSDAEGHETDYAYDSRSRLTQTVDPKLYVTNIQYLSGTALPWKVTENDGRDTTFGYDSTSGILNYVKDEVGNESYSHYTPSSRTYYTWGTGAKSTKTIHDDMGRRNELHTYRTAKSGYSAMSGAGDKTTWSYDSHSGVLLSEEDNLGRKTEYLSYDAAGRLLQKKDPRGAKTNYSYYGSGDAHFSGLLKEVSYDLSGVISGQNVAATRSEKYEYHQRMLVMTKMRQQRTPGSGTWDDWVYSFDDDPVDHEAGRLLSETLPAYYYGSVYNKINYTYQTDTGGFNPSSNILNGRMSAFNIYNNSTYKSSYTFGSDGRLGNLDWTKSGSSYKFEYGYHANTDLIETIRTKESSTTRQLQTRSYASNSHAMTQIRTDNGSGGHVTDVKVIRDNLRRIKEHKINGWVGSQASGSGSGIFESYSFTTRGEVDVTTTKILNSDWSGGTQIGYKNRDYDAMGNRDDDGVDSIVENFEAGLSFWSVPGPSQGYKYWSLDQGGTPSSSTGPSYDHTTGGSSGTYLYMETSSGHAYNSGDQAVVESKSFVPSSSSTISFYYHMYGADMGTLHLEVLDGSYWTSVWNRSGLQHGSSTASYSSATVSLSSYSGDTIRLRFRGVAAGGWKGDMAIDDLTITDATAVGFLANSLNQYDDLVNNGVLVGATYDYAGNITYDGLYLYEYDAKNQLVEMISLSPSETYYFMYDPMGRRIKKSGTDISTTQFMYQGWNVVAELNSSYSIVKRYVWGLDASNTVQGAGGVGGLLMIEDGSTRYYPVYDARQNVVGLQNSGGALVAWYDYDPFGKLIGSGGSAAGVNPFRFSTKYTDHDIDPNHVYYGLRYYHADIGRFLNRDPIGTSGGLNIYAAMGNDPVNSYDLLGMVPISYTDVDAMDDLGYTNTAEFYRDGNGTNGGVRKFANPSIYWGLSMINLQQQELTGNRFDVDFESGSLGSGGKGARLISIDDDGTQFFELDPFATNGSGVSQSYSGEGFFPSSRPEGWEPTWIRPQEGEKYFAAYYYDWNGTKIRSSGSGEGGVVTDVLVGALPTGGPSVSAIKWLRNSKLGLKLFGPTSKKVPGSQLAEAASELGIDLSKITVKNGRASLKIDTAWEVNIGSIRAIKAHLKGLGATSGTVDTGMILNGQISEKLLKVAQEGGTFMGARVRQVTEGIERFELIFDKL